MGRAGETWLGAPREWLENFGEITRFGARVAGTVYSGRVLRFFGESVRQAGILILGSALIIWAFVFILGLQCGIQGAYFFRAQGAPGYAGLFAAFPRELGSAFIDQPWKQDIAAEAAAGATWCALCQVHGICVC